MVFYPNPATTIGTDIHLEFRDMLDLPGLIVRTELDPNTFTMMLKVLTPAGGLLAERQVFTGQGPVSDPPHTPEPIGRPYVYMRDNNTGQYDPPAVAAQTAQEWNEQALGVAGPTGNGDADLRAQMEQSGRDAAALWHATAGNGDARGVEQQP